MATSSKPKSHVRRLSITPVGEQRTAAAVKEEIAAALRDALEETNKDSKQKIKATLKSEGAFVGIAVAAIWALKAFGAGALGAAGKIAVEKLNKRLNKKLRSRSLEPGPAPGKEEKGKKETTTKNKKR
jgi:hypothetical protein